MFNTQNSRRNFLGSMAILSVGSAFGSATRLISDITSPLDLKQMWKQFCQKNGGYTTTKQIILDPLAQSQGHLYEEGSLVLFPMHNLLAHATWVFWSMDKKKPADIIVSFYDSRGSNKKLFCLNRFEWEAFEKMPANDENSDIIALLKETYLTNRVGESSSKSYPLRVRATRGREVMVTSEPFAGKVSINRQFIYSV